MSWSLRSATMAHLSDGRNSDRWTWQFTTIFMAIPCLLFPKIFPVLCERLLQLFEVGVGLDLDHPKISPARAALANHAFIHAVLSLAHVVRKFPGQLASVNDPRRGQMTEIGHELLRSKQAKGFRQDIEDL